MAKLFCHTPYISRRVDRAMAGTSFVGAIIGLVANYCQFWFLDIWLGGAIAMPFGLAVGVALEYRRNAHASLAWSRVAATAALSLFLASCAFFVLIPTTGTAKANVHTLSTMPPGSVARIRVYEPFSSRVMATVDDTDALDEFVIAARDVVLHHRGSLGRNEHLVNWWFVLQLDDGRRLEIEWSHRSDLPNTVSGMFVETTPHSLTNRGQFVSTNLRAWFRKHLAGQLK